LEQKEFAWLEDNLANNSERCIAET
jgi:hypothetical protein